MGRALDRSIWETRGEIVARGEASGLCWAEFARREGLDYGRLMSWRQHFSRRDSAAAVAGLPTDSVGAPLFRELVVVPAGSGANHERSHGAPLAEVALPSGAVVRLYSGTAAACELLRTALAGDRGC